MTNQKRISQLRKSIELQTRTKANLEAIQLADSGKTVEVCDQIIASLKAQLEIYTKKHEGVIA